MAKEPYTRLKPRSWKDDMPMSSGDDKHFPSLTMSLKDLPEAADWEIGKEYSLDLKVKQVSISKDKDGGGSVRFDIVAVNPEEDDDDEDDEDEED